MVILNYWKFGINCNFELGSLQAICKHEFVDVLKDPGSADLSAYVDFEALRYAVKESKCDAVALGPVEQRHFLKKLGIKLILCFLVIDWGILKGLMHGLKY